MEFCWARFYFQIAVSLVIICFAAGRPSLDRDVEMLDDLLNATIPYIDIRQAVTNQHDFNKETSEKQVIPGDVELVPPFDSNAKRGKSTAGTLIGAILGVSSSRQCQM